MRIMMMGLCKKAVDQLLHERQLPRVVALLVLHFILASVLLTLGVHPKPYGDEEYSSAAVGLVRRIAGDTASPVRLIKGPLTSIFYTPAATVGILAGRTAMLSAARLMNLVVVTLGIAAVLAEHRMNRKLSLLMLGFFLLSPAYVYYSLGMLAEPIAFAAVCALYVIWNRIMRPGSSIRKTALLSGALVVLGGIRPNLALLPLLGLACAGCGYVVIERRDTRRTLSVSIVASLLALIGLAVLYAGARSERETQTGFIRSEAARALIAGRFQLRERWWDTRHFDEAVRGPDDPDLLGYRRQSELLGSWGDREFSEVLSWWLRDLRDHPLTVIRIMVSKAVLSGLWVPNRVYSWASSKPGSLLWLVGCVIVAFGLINVLVGIAPVLWLARSRLENILISWPVWGPWLGVTLFVMIFEMEPRYVFPGRLAVVVTSAILVDEWWTSKRVRTRRHRS